MIVYVVMYYDKNTNKCWIGNVYKNRKEAESDASNYGEEYVIEPREII